MSEHARLGPCTSCRQTHCIEGIGSGTGALLQLLCHHHGRQVETDARAKVCTDCGYVEFWVRSPRALKLRPAADEVRSAR